MKVKYIYIYIYISSLGLENVYIIKLGLEDDNLVSNRDGTKVLKSSLVSPLFLLTIIVILLCNRLYNNSVRSPRL